MLHLNPRFDSKSVRHSEPRRWRRWLQFGLRSLILTVVASSILLGLLGARIDRTRRAMNALNRLNQLPGVQVDTTTEAHAGFIDTLVSWCLGDHSSLYRFFVRFANAPDSEGPPNFDEYLDATPMIDVVVIESTQWRDEHLAALEHFPHLRALIVDTATISEEGLKYLSSHRDTLGQVYFNRRPISDRGLEHLSALQNVHDLSLDVQQLTPAGIQYLAEMPQLSELYLVGVTDNFLESMPKMPNLYYLRLKSGSVTSAGIRHIAAIRDWTLWAVDRLAMPQEYYTFYGDESVVHLSGHPLTNDELREIAETRGIEQLVVVDGEVTDDGMQTLASQKQLKRVILRNCCISDIGLDSLLRMPNLEQLDVSGCGITVAGFQKIDTCPSLHTIRAYDTCLTPADEIQIYRWSTNPNFSLNSPF